MTPFSDVFWIASAGVAFAVSLLVSVVRRSRFEATQSQVVVVTGCDSGLGFSLAVHACRDLGLTVVATCLEVDGPGAAKLRRECPGPRLRLLPLDVTSGDQVNAAVEAVRQMLRDEPLLELKCVVNNAAVMVFGEFEWQTERLIRQQVEVNLLGTMRVTKAFCSLLRHYQGRVISVSSHCALASLPGLATYGATKAAIRAWSDSLRVEEAKYGVHVVTMVPGSFIDKSSIMSRHPDNAKEMEAAMTAADKSFFGEYFHTYHSYLAGLSDPGRPPNVIKDPALHAMFDEALLSCNPRSNYVHGPLRYSVYHFLFKISPVWLRDWLVVRFVQMPVWTAK